MPNSIFRNDINIGNNTKGLQEQINELNTKIVTTDTNLSVVNSRLSELISVNIVKTEFTISNPATGQLEIRYYFSNSDYYFLMWSPSGLSFGNVINGSTSIYWSK